MFEQPLVIDTCCHQLSSEGNLLADMEVKLFHMSQWKVYTLEWVLKMNIFKVFLVDFDLVDVL